MRNSSGISALRLKLAKLTRAMGSWLEPTNLLLLGCSLIYGLIGEPVDALILLIFVGVIAGLGMPCASKRGIGLLPTPASARPWVCGWMNRC